MGVTRPGDPSATAGIVGAIACTTIYALTIGLTFPLLSFVLDAAGHSETAIGINAAMTPVGVLVASPFYPRVIRRFGAWRVAVGCLAGSGLLLLLMGLAPVYGALLLLRLALGVVDVGIFIVSETWINQLARPATRGRVIGLYATALSAGFAAGPLILSVTGIDGLTPFAVGALGCAAAIPIVLAIRHTAPGQSSEKAVSSWRFLRLAPTLLVAIAAYAFWESALLALFPVYGLAMGMEARFVTLAIAVCILGNTVLQVPLGWASDRTSRRATMIACALVGLLGAAVLPSLPGARPALLAVLFVWGAVAGGLYTMAMAELGDRFDGAELVAGNAAFALAFGVGGVIGGPATGLVMDIASAPGFYHALGVVFLLTAGISGWRWWQARG